MTLAWPDGGDVAEPLFIVLTEENQLRSWVLSWDLPNLQLQFFDDVSAALAAAREAEVWLFLYDARGHESSMEGVVRRLRQLSTEPEILVLAEGEAPELGLPRENLYLRDMEESALREQLDRLLRLARLRRTSGIVGQSPAIRELISTIAQVAPLEVPVLIEGESGTGKELVARALHEGSRRADQPFVSVNVGSLSESLLESELFGHEKGAFTGAIERHAGVFERAKGGTLFLDEVGEMTPNMQVKLLRVLETGEFIRVGGGETLHADIRLLTATHRRLEERIERGAFRGDLYYRMKVVKIELPPLRERREDIPILAQHFLVEANEAHQLSLRGFTREASEQMIAYPWPGNVRELRNLVLSMAVLAKGSHLEAGDLPPELELSANFDRRLPVTYIDGPGLGGGGADPLLAHTLVSMARDLSEIRHRLEQLEQRLGGSGVPGEGIPSWASGAPVAEVMPLGMESPGDLESAEKAMIQAALGANGGNRRLAAEQLGISERTLYRKLRSYGLST